jgi:hypothetical protein
MGRRDVGGCWLLGAWCSWLAMTTARMLPGAKPGPSDRTASAEQRSK